MDKNGETSIKAFRPLLNAAWLTIITMTTTGYGDFYPKTSAARLFSVFSFIIGNVMISLMVVLLSHLTTMTSNEIKAYNTIKKKMAVDKSTNRAGDVVKAALLYKKIHTIYKD